MKVNTNKWNKIRYSLYAPGYDIAARILDGSRKKSIETMHVKSAQKVLIIGAGTGLDLEHLPIGCEITATDITPKMIDLVEKRNKKLGHNLSCHVMDGQKLDFDNNTFDFVVLHLILSVIPDPIACIKEAERLLKPDGKIAVFDKFVKKGEKLSSIRKMANFFTNLFFSDISRNFEQIISKTQLQVKTDLPVNFKGNFRIINLVKQ